MLHFRSKSKFSRVLIGLAILSAVLSVAAPHTTSADTNSDVSWWRKCVVVDKTGGVAIKPCSTTPALVKAVDKITGIATAISNIQLSVIGWVIYGFNYFITVVVGLFISVVVYGIAIILQLSDNVMNTLAVQTGFQVSLAVANLGFVLGIIIIAIATILHRQTYGIKSLLWKLVFAAILVNFSLIIGGVIINAANSLTTTFLRGFPGGDNGTAGFTGFADALAGAFSPHRPLLTGFDQASLDQAAQSISNTANTANSSDLAGSAVAKVILPLFSVIFVAGMLIVIFITLCIFFFMLIVRYLYLSFLLILMPLAWLLWIFPLSSHLFKKWWNTFLRWTFFAPIVIFFLYLAIATSQKMSGAYGTGGVAGPAAGLAGLGYKSTGNIPIISGLSSAFGTAANTLMGTFLQMMVVIGLAIGGLYTADKLSIMGAAAGLNAIKGVKNAAVGYAAKQGKKGLRAGFRAAGGERAVQKMRTGEFARGLSGVPVVGKSADWLLKRGASVAGRAIEPHLGNEKMVEDARKNVPKDPKKIKENLLGNMNMEDRFAHVARLQEMSELDENVMVGNRKVKDFMDEHGEDVKNYGQGKMSDDVNKTLGSTKEMRDAEKEFAALAKAGKDTTDAFKRMDEATKAFVEKLGKGDMSKMNVNDVFKESSKNTPLTQALARNMAKHGSHLVSSALPKMKSPALRAFAETYRKEIKTELDKGPTARKLAAVSPTLTKEERDRVVEKIREGMTEEERILDRAQKSFNDALANNVLFGSPADASTGAAAPPPPPATPHP